MRRLRLVVLSLAFACTSLVAPPEVLAAGYNKCAVFAPGEVSLFAHPVSARSGGCNGSKKFNGDCLGTPFNC